MNQTLAYLPSSGDWACACGAELERARTEVTYLGNAFTIELLACPRCGLTLVPEELAVGKMLEVEQLLEDK